MKLPDGKCICQVCTCGRHHCVHQSARGRSSIKAECFFETTQQADFVAKAGERTRSFKPDIKRTQAGAFDGSTTYGGDFANRRAHALVKSCKPSQQYVPSPSKFQGETTAQRDYRAVAAAKRESFKPKQTAIQSGSGEYSTTYGSDHKVLGGRPATSRKPAQSRTKPGTFRGDSTYKQDFPEKMAERSRSMRPAVDRRADLPPLDGISTSQAAYTGVGVERTPSFKPSVMRSDPGAFEGSSTAQHDYAPQPFSKREPFKPKVKHLEQQPGLYETTYKSDLVTPRGVDHAKSCKPHQGYTPSKARFDGTTTYGGDFERRPQTAPAQSLKPTQVRHQSVGPTDYTTTSRAAYTGQAMGRARNFKPAVSRTDPAPFEGISSAHADYRHMPVARRTSMRPMQSRGEVGEFSGITSQQADYLEWDLGCPASRLPANIRTECNCRV